MERLELAVKEGTTDAQLESELAGDLALCNRWDEALAHAKRAVELAPENAAFFQNWCTLAVLHKNYGEAVTAARAALSLNPAELRTQSNLGVALLHLGQIPEATSHFSAIVDAQPTAVSQCYLGICLLNQPGKRDEALTHLREAVRLDPTNTKWQEALQNALMGH